MSLETVLAAARRVSPRAWVRSAFLAVFLYSCWQLWRYFDWALGTGPAVQRPEATAGLVPLGGLMSLAAWLKTGTFDIVMPAAIVIIVAALALSMLYKRAFCGWVCPVGTSVSAIAWLGRLLNGGRARRVPRKLDIALRVPKYVVAALILAGILLVPVAAIIAFQGLPYYATADLKILYGLLNPVWWYFAIAAFVGGTTLLLGTNTWCRYLCPLGAVYGACSSASIGTVKRDETLCIDCKACDKACAASISVSTSTRAIRSAECDGCQDCTRACATPGALETRVAGVRIPWRYWPVLVVGTWLLIWGVAVLTGHWQHGLSDSTIGDFMRAMKTTVDF